MRRLERANAVRAEKKKIKRDALIGNVDAAKLVCSPPPVIHKEPVGNVLTWFRGIGPAKAKAIVLPITGSVTVPIGKLSETTRRRIADKLSARA